LSESLTDWERVDALTDKEIDLSDCAEITPEMFARAVVRRGTGTKPEKVQLTLQIDSDVVAWFKRQGRGYQSRINALLRTYMETHSKAQ
jgi:uncharacterized protein (DUF4415 family)